MPNLETIKTDDGQLPTFAFPGGYPMFYLDGHNSILCAKCANESLSDADEIDSFRPVESGVHYEGDPLNCENCSENIDPAYGK
jgi:hypothetical protein